MILTGAVVNALRGHVIGTDKSSKGVGQAHREHVQASVRSFAPNPTAAAGEITRSRRGEAVLHAGPAAAAARGGSRVLLRIIP